MQCPSSMRQGHSSSMGPEHPRAEVLEHPSCMGLDHQLHKAEHPSSMWLEHPRAGASQFHEAGASQLRGVRASQYWSIPAPWGQNIPILEHPRAGVSSFMRLDHPSTEASQLHGTGSFSSTGLEHPSKEMSQLHEARASQLHGAGISQLCRVRASQLGGSWLFCRWVRPSPVFSGHIQKQRAGGLWLSALAQPQPTKLLTHQLSPLQHLEPRSAPQSPHPPPRAHPLLAATQAPSAQ